MLVKLKSYDLTYDAWQVSEAGWTFDEHSRALNGDTPVNIGDWIITTEALAMFVVHDGEFEKAFERLR
jgi:hypothetical protein